LSENKITGKCPICPRGCDLSAPNCGRGENYAKTGELPTEQGEGHEHGHGHGHGHEHGHPQFLQFEKQEQQLVMKYLHHAVAAVDRGGITQEQAPEMFTVLTGEETKELAKLLEKLANHWMELAPQKTPHHGRRHLS
jgi:hypothetical protein